MHKVFRLERKGFFSIIKPGIKYFREHAEEKQNL